MSTISKLLKLGGEATEASLHAGNPAALITQLEEMGFEHLGSGTHRMAFAHGERVLKVARENPLQNISEAASSLRYPELHPYMAKTLGLSESGHLSAMERAFPSARDKPSLKGMLNLKRRFLDLHSGNLVGGKAVDYGVPRVVHPILEERQLAVQAFGGTQGIRDIFADVPGFGAWVDEFEGGLAQVPSAVPESPLLMRGQRMAQTGGLRGLLQQGHSSARSGLPVRSSAPARFRPGGRWWRH